jgi:uncharacterized repeat protein (TIGR01451 family)
MRFTNRKTRGLRRLALVGFLALLAVSGAANVGQAGTNGALTPTITVLNDNTDGLILGQPTPGGNIGYDLNVNNTSTNTLNHILFTDTIPSPATIDFINAPPGVSCSGSGTNTLSCSSTQLAASSQFDVIVLFKTDPNGAPGTGTVHNVFSGTYAPASQNSTNHRTDPTKTFSIFQDRTYAGGGVGEFVAQSLLLANDSHGQGQLDVGGADGQASHLTMPPGFFNHDYVGTTLKNLLTASPGCSTCLKYQTNVNMPLAPAFAPGNPFWTGTNAQPFQVTITIPGVDLPSGFKPTGVWHQDDSVGGTPTQLHNCTYISGVPQPQATAEGICIASLVQLKPSKDVVTVEWALSNGSYWIG